MQIFLIRHGETASNAAHIVQTPDTPLNERGIAQVERLAERLADAGITRILTSDLSRAHMTAERLQANTGAVLDLAPLLQERNFGDLRGHSYADLGIDIMDPQYTPPGGESWDVFHTRVESAWQRVQRAIAQAIRGNEGNLAVVTHGLVCHGLALRHLSLPAGAETPRRWDNASLTTIDGAPPWCVHLLNCCAHLAGDTAPAAG